MAPIDTDAGDATVQTPGYAVQAGAFRNADNAHALLESLQADGFTPSIYNLTDAASGLWYIVRLGEHSNKADARQQMQDFKLKTRREAVITPVDSIQPVRLSAQ